MFVQLHNPDVKLAIGGVMKGGVMRQMALLAEVLSKHPPLQTVCQLERPGLGHLQAIGGAGAKRLCCISNFIHESIVISSLQVVA